MLFVWLIIFLIIWVLLFVIVRIYFKKAFKILSIISIVLFFAILLIGIILFLEAKEMGEKFPTSNNTFLFDLNGNIVAGFKIYPAQEPLYIENIDNMDLYYQKKDFDAMKEDSYLMFILTKELFEGNGDIEFGQFTFTYEESYALLESDEPMGLFAKKVLETEEHATEEAVVEQLTENFGNDDRLKSLIFAAIFSDTIAETQAVGLIEGIQKDYITVYPQKLIFRLIKLIPESMVKDVISGMEIKNK